MEQNPNVYWAAEADGATLVDRAMGKYSLYQKKLKTDGRLLRAAQTLSAYYGRGVDGARLTNQVQTGGEQGETLLSTHNGIRPLVTQILNLVAGQRPGMKPVATNTDADSVGQTNLADGLRGYYEKDADMPSLELDVVRGGLLASSWSLIQGWKPTLGAEVAVDPDTGRVVYEGDVEIITVPMWRSAYDLTATTTRGRRWVLFRKAANRFELASQYPEMADKLLQSASVATLSGNDWGMRLAADANVEGLDALFGDTLEDDSVWLFELRHLPTPALPNGRLVRFVSNDCVLFDSQAKGAKYPYEELHAYEWAPERVVGTATGHTGAFDLLGQQEMMDVITSSLATTANIYGNQHIWTPDPTGLNPVQLQSGPTVLGGPVKPEVLSFPGLKPELLQYFGLIRELMREGASLNNVVMGQPDKGMPAQAMALMRAQAVQYYQAAQGEYLRLVEQNTTGILLLLQRFARTERVTQIAGKSGAYEMKTWKAADVAGVKRWECEPINPMTRTFEARTSLAENMAQHGWLDKRGYLSVYQTGDLKEALEADTAQLELVTRIKDLLRQGIGLPPVDMQASQVVDPQTGVPMMGSPVFKDDGQPHVRLVKTDPHWKAYKEYAAVLASPEARENPAVVAAVTSVLTETLRLWGSLTPDEIAALGGQPLPSQMAAMGPPGMGGPPANDNKPVGPPGPANDNAPNANHPSAPGMPPGAPPTRLPHPPQDPLTGAKQGADSLAIPHTAA